MPDVIFVTSSANTYGIGRVVHRDGPNCIVEYFVDPNHRLTESLPAARLVRSTLLPGHYCFIREASTNRWVPARIHTVEDGEVWIRTTNRPVFLVDPADVYIRSLVPDLDPVEYLVLFAQGSPSDHYFRTQFVRATIAQRRLSHGITGLISSRILLLPHQIRVVRRVLSDPICRYLLADEVGLGKTVEAGIIIRQHMIDHPGRRVLVLVPRALKGQWSDELDQKFDIFSLRGQPEIIDYEEFLSEGRPNRYSLVVIDEAHNLVSGAISGTLAARRRFSQIKSLCNTSESVLLLTATPLTNHEEDYLAMLHLVDPERHRLDQLESFREKIALRQNIGQLLLGLNPEADPFEIQVSAEALRDLLPADPVAQAKAAELLEINDEPSQLSDRVRATRVHLTETYRLNRRMVRTRRESLRAEDLLPRPQVIQISEPLWDPASSESIVTLLEDWREYSIPFTADNHVLRKQHTTLLRLFWTAYAAGDHFLGRVLRSRISGRVDGELAAELEREEVAALVASLPDADEAVILRRIAESSLQSCLEGARISRIAMAIRQSTAANRTAKWLIFTTYASSCVDAWQRLKADFGEDCVAHIHGRMDDVHADEQSDRFVTNADCRVLVCDRVGEEGRNLQIADHVVFLDLPFEPFRLEQRCGRFDRIGQTHVVVTAICGGPELALSPPRAWLEVLRDGFGVFSQSISALQFFTEASARRLMSVLYLEGAVGLRREIPSICSELQRERQRVREQDVLDSIEDRSVNAVDWIPELLKAEANPKIGIAIHNWIRNRLKFGGRDDVSQRNVYSLLPGTHTDRMAWAHHDLAGEYTGTYDRETALRDPRLALFRLGHPFIDFIEEQSLWDDRGRTFAVWRQDPGWDTEPGAEWAGFRFDFTIEGDLEPMIAAVVAHSYPLNEVLLRRKIDALFPPIPRYLFVRCDGVKVKIDEPLFSVLDKPYCASNKGGSDTKIMGSLESILEEIGFPGLWEPVCRDCRRRAEEEVQAMPRLWAQVEQATEAADTQLRLVVESLRVRGEQEMIAFESDLAKALVKGIRKPRVHLDAVGFVIISGRPRPVEG